MNTSRHNKKANLSLIFKKAWELAKNDGKRTLKGGTYLKQAWAWFKAGMIEEPTEKGLFDYITIKDYNNILSYMKVKYYSYFKIEGDLEDFILDMQERVLVKLPHFNPEKGNIKTWINRIFSNAIIDYGRVYKNNIKKESLFTTNDEKEEIKFTDNSQQESDIYTEKEEKFNDINKAIANIKNLNHQKAVKMYYFNKLSYEEIGAKLAVSLPVARVFVNRGIKDIKKLMAV